jgi:hypothetical protein
VASWQALSRPIAAGGGGRRPAFTGLATRPYSGHQVEGGGAVGGSPTSASRQLYSSHPGVAKASPPSFCSIGAILPSRPAHRKCRRAQRPSRMVRLRTTASAARSVPDGREHDGMLDRVGARVRAPPDRASEATPSKNVLPLFCVQRTVSRVCGRSCLRFASDRRTDSALPHTEDEFARHLAAPFFEPAL